ncbi:unnamed protein product, partial [Discosporangium mesarthrocarpum]
DPVLPAGSIRFGSGGDGVAELPSTWRCVKCVTPRQLGAAVVLYGSLKDIPGMDILSDTERSNLLRHFNVVFGRTPPSTAGNKKLRRTVSTASISLVCFPSGQHASTPVGAAKAGNVLGSEVGRQRKRVANFTTGSLSQKRTKTPLAHPHRGDDTTGDPMQRNDRLQNKASTSGDVIGMLVRTGKVNSPRQGARVPVPIREPAGLQPSPAATTATELGSGLGCEPPAIEMRVQSAMTGTPLGEEEGEVTTTIPDGGHNAGIVTGTTVNKVAPVGTKHNNNCCKTSTSISLGHRNCAPDIRT